MTRFVFCMAIGLSLAACSGPSDRAGCAQSADCGPGAYCAHTGDGAVCWPDPVAPTVTEVVVSCARPVQGQSCARDGVLRVTARAADDHELAAVRVELSSAPGTSFEMTASSGMYRAEIALADLPFDAFEQAVGAKVTAVDGAGNEAAASSAAGLTVSRLRWAYPAGWPLSPAAVAPDGTVIVALATTSQQVLALKPDGTVRWQASAGTQLVTAAPMVGAGAVWVASAGGTLYALSLDGAMHGTGCNTGGPLDAPPALAGASASRVVAANEAGSLYAADLNGLCNQTGLSGAALSAPVVAADGTVYAASGGYLESFTMLSGGGLDGNWTAPPLVGGSVSAAAAIDSAANVWTVSASGTVMRTTPDGTAARVGTVGASVNGVVVLPDGTAVLADDSTNLKRISSASEPPPWEKVQLAGVGAAPVALKGPEALLLVPTTLGWLYAIQRDSGAVSWSHNFGSSALRTGNVFQQAGDALPTAYFPSADGKLYAVVVDGPLDPASPWPKAWHDAQNTGNAATPL